MEAGIDHARTIIELVAPGFDIRHSLNVNRPASLCVYD